MIKVDHAGENGAVNIYRAQTLVARLRAPSLVKRLKHFQSHEEEHRRIFAKYLSDKGIRRCVSYHLNGIGGYALGFITAIIGPSAIAATTYAVESVVLEHLNHQMEYLQVENPDAYNAVSSIYLDEKEHHDEAKQRLQDGNRALTRIMVSIIKTCTEAVIRFGMR
ncbi:demethoxyubiquinone hydroxylase family protein [Litorimonas sp.]|uniref:demethoxyubiquinone hydroxylase family protein n=1 Tax=Litorimonas sp. TaxID=1892381 RepID=UPI003A84CEFA